METILRVFQVLLAIGLIGVVLLQRSEGGGLGIGSSGGMGSFMSVRGTANFLTRVTSILGALFMITCLALALIAKPAEAPQSIFDVPAPTSMMPAPTSAPPQSSAPAPVEEPAASPLSAPETTPAPAAAETTPPAAATPSPLSMPTTETPAPPAKAASPKAPAAKSKASSHTGASRPSGQ